MTLDVGIAKRSLVAIQHGAIPHGELARFVQLAEALVVAFLETRRASVWRVAEHHGLTLVDVAEDCIAEAFRRAGRGVFPLLTQFTTSLRADLESLPDLEVHIAFRAFILRIAERQLAKLYAQADPEGAKILRNLREAIKRNDDLALISDFRGKVVSVARLETLDHLAPFPPEELERHLTPLVHRHHSIPEILCMFVNVLSSQSLFRRSVPLMTLMDIVRRLYLDRDKLLDSVDDGHEEFSADELEEIRAGVERAVNEKIFVTYYAKGKVDNHLAEAMSQAIHDMLADWCDGNANGISLSRYLRRYAEIDEIQYESSLRTKMEYLCRVAREEFAARLMREL